MIIPIIGWGLSAIGAGTLWWYMSLSAEEKRRADQMAADYASQLFEKAVDQLSVGEARRVHDLVKQHFNN